MKFVIEELMFLKNLLTSSTNKGYSYAELKILKGLLDRISALLSSVASPEECPVAKEDREKPKFKKKFKDWQETVVAYLLIEMQLELDDSEIQFLISRFITFNGFSSDAKSVDLIFKVAKKLGV